MADDGRAQLNSLQQIELEMLKVIIEVCEKLNITYYASNGTLLGTIRHKGFIPWDDDIDISLYRDDYEKFLKEAQQYLPSNYKVMTYIESEDDTVYTARVIKLDTKLINRIANIPHEENVWIDLWALDGMPGNKVINRIHRAHLMERRFWVQISKYDQLIHQHRPGRPWYEKAIMKVCEVTHFGSGIDTKKAKSRVEKTMMSYSPRKAAYAINFWSPYKFREEMPVEWYGKGKFLPFESIMIHVPNEPEKILEKLYGDYMQLPPEDQRNIQHCMEIVEI